MNRDEIEAQQYGLAIGDDVMFIEAIGPNGFSSHPDYPQDELLRVIPFARRKAFDEEIIEALRVAYMANNGAAFLRIIQSYAEPYFEAAAEDAVKRRMDNMALDNMADKADFDRDTMRDKMEDGK